MGTDTKVMQALCGRGRELGKTEIGLSLRDLQQRASIGNRGTVTSSLKRLGEPGYVEQARLRDGHPKRVGDNRTPIDARAYMYRLTIPRDIPEPLRHRGGFGGGGALSGSGLHTLDPGHDVWRYQGLAATRPTFGYLLNHPATVKEIASATGKRPETVRRHLKALSRVCLVEQKPSGEWVTFERPFDVVAQELGTLGLGEQQSQRHSRERDAYRATLERREAQLLEGTRPIGGVAASSRRKSNRSELGNEKPPNVS